MTEDIHQNFVPFLQLQRAEKQKFLLGVTTPSELLYSRQTPCGLYFRVLQSLNNRMKNSSVDSFKTSTSDSKFISKQSFDPKKAFESGTAPGSQKLYNLSDPILSAKQKFVECVNQNRNFYSIRERNMLDWMYNSAEN